VIKVVVNDGDGGSTGATKTLKVVAVEDKPVIQGFDTPVTYTVGGSPVILDDNATVKDVDSSNFENGKLTVSLTGFAQNTDRLSIRNQGTGAGQIGITGANLITFGGVVIGSFTGGAQLVSLEVKFNANATAAAVQAVLRNIMFSVTTPNPSLQQRMVNASLRDGDGATSNVVSKAIYLI